MNRQRFDHLYNAYYPAIFKYALRRLPSGSDDAGDVAAEVFATAWRRIGRVPEAPEDRLWLYGVARRTLDRHRRSRWRRERLNSRLQFEAESDSIWANPASISTETRMSSALEGLEFRDREVLYLVAWDGLDNSEAAKVLGCSPNALAVRLHRARSRLRVQLGEPLTSTTPPQGVTGMTMEP